MSTRAKGRRREVMARDELKEQGFRVMLAPMASRWQRQTDMFGLWDIIAVRHDTVRFIQVKSRKIYGKALLPFHDFKCPLNCSREIWTYKKGKSGFDIQYL